MKKHGLLNSRLVELIARLGHTDVFVVADCGLPIPRDIPVVDLTLVFGIPRFADVVSYVLDEVVIEGVCVAQEASEQVRSWLPEVTEEITHEELKERLSQAAFVIRTGETTPYANAIFCCGVPF